jgi:NTP pyrophosphatase (non-canonical NTP hydrolase)
MNNYYLDEKHKEIMSIAQEECAEVIQAISKIFRFGLDESFEGRTNRERLTSELGDLQCMITLLKQYEVVDDFKVHQAELVKRTRLSKWSNIFTEVQ